MPTFGSPLFGSSLFGGAQAGASGAPGLISLQSILIPALRIAGITQLPGTTPGPDQFNELIPMVNMMMASASLDGHRIFTTQPQQYPLTAGKKIYTIGPGGDMDGPRPISIQAANVMFPTSPVVRWPLKILDVNDWAAITIEDLTGAPPMAIYYDNNVDADGLAKIYVYMQPPDGYTLELFQWQELPDGFQAVTDQFSAPPGYAHWMTWKMAMIVAGMYPLESKISPIAAQEEMKALQAIVTLNTKARKIGTEAGLDVQEPFGPFRGWLYGVFGNYR